MAGIPVLYHGFVRSEAGPLARGAGVPVRADVAIVGGGVIGLMCGWRLVRRGLSVALFDARAAGSGTSAAATGMLAAAAEHEPGGDPLLDLACESLALWPALRDALEAESGIAIDYWAKGTLVVAVGRDEVERLRARHRQQVAAGLDVRWMTGSAVRDLEPGLKPSVSAGILCPGDHQVDPPRVLSSLRAAFVGAGGLLVEGATVERFEREGGRVAGVVVDGTVCRAGTVVLATGAVAGSDGLMPRELELPLRPLKGQSLALRTRPPASARGRAAGNLGLPIDHVVWTAEVHLAPKSDGRLIVGATMEEAGFDPHLTAGGLYALLEGVRRVLPGVEEMAIDGFWAGYRPTTEDDAPVIGASGVPGLVLALGHHRNGYLLAPATAQAIEELVMTGRVAGAAERFGIGRFAPDRETAA